MLAIAPALIAIVIELNPHPVANADTGVAIFLGIATYVWTVQAICAFIRWLTTAGF